MKWSSQRLAMVAAVMMALLSACPSMFGQWRLTIKPEDAFFDPRQVALAAASKAGNVRAIENAVKEGANVKAIGRQNPTTLWYALVAGEKKAFARLLELGADPNQRNDAGEPLNGWCVTRRDSDYLKLALAHGGNPNAVNPISKQSIVFRTNSVASNERLEILLRAGADINSRDKYGSTLINVASGSRLMKKVLILLQRGADPFIRDESEGDVASGIFCPNWATKTEGYRARGEFLRLLEARGLKFDWALTETVRIHNFDEATGKEPPMWLNRSAKEPNPEWVKANSEKPSNGIKKYFGDRHRNTKKFWSACAQAAPPRRRGRRGGR